MFWPLLPVLSLDPSLLYSYNEIYATSIGRAAFRQPRCAELPRARGLRKVELHYSNSNRLKPLSVNRHKPPFGALISGSLGSPSPLSKAARNRCFTLFPHWDPQIIQSAPKKKQQHPKCPSKYLKCPKELPKYPKNVSRAGLPAITPVPPLNHSKTICVYRVFKREGVGRQSCQT